MKRIPNVSYGLNQPLNIESPLPIIAQRAPTTMDTAELGTIWVYPADNSYWVLTSVVAGEGNWEISSLNSLIIDGDTGSVRPNDGVITITGGSSGATFHGTGSTLTLELGALTATSLTTTDGITIDSDGLTVTAGGITVTAGGITATAGGIAATVGNITASNGNVVLSTAATKLVLPGPVDIITGSGAPNNSLALHVGDMYINTTAASSTTRLYIATAASTWTNVTCAG